MFSRLTDRWRCRWSPRCWSSIRFRFQLGLQHGWSTSFTWEFNTSHVVLPHSTWHAQHVAAQGHCKSRATEYHPWLALCHGVRTINTWANHVVTCTRPTRGNVANTTVIQSATCATQRSMPMWYHPPSDVSSHVARQHST